MLNPSTADATVNDPTIRRCIGFAQRWGFGALDVGNIFAWRSTDPRVLRDLSDPVHPDNDGHLRAMVATANSTVLAHGNHGVIRGRGAEVLKLVRDMGVEPWCFRLTQVGQPEHPLYQPGDRELVRVCDA